MDPRVAAAVSEGRGLVRRARLLDLGVSPGEIRANLRRGTWIAVRRGVYTTADLWDSLDEYVGRPRLESRAVIATVRRDWVLSHESAAHELGMPVLAAADGLVHITRPGWTNAWTEHGVGHHLARFDSSQVVRVDDVTVLDAARTGVDIARDGGLARGVIACDAALGLGATRDDLWRAVEPMRNWPGVCTARRSVELADGGAENPHETLGRLLVIEAGIGVPETQFPVSTRLGVFWCDIRVGNLVIETDGRVKYRRSENGGLSADPERTVWDEKQRQRAVHGRGLVVARLVWSDYWGARRAAAIRELRDAHEESVRRSGATLLPELAAEAAELRRLYPRRPGRTG